jgi:hypothetical protein
LEILAAKILAQELETMMKLSELIAAVGKGRMTFQILDKCVISLDRGPRKSTVVKFETGESVSDDRTARLGIIVWLDRDAVHDALQANAPAMTADDWAPNSYAEELSQVLRAKVA